MTTKRENIACRPGTTDAMARLAAENEALRVERDEMWKPSGLEYDRAIHHNPDAKAWADLFVATFPNLYRHRETMIGWFANAMMAMYDHLKNKEAKSVNAIKAQGAREAMEQCALYTNRTFIRVDDLLAAIADMEN